MSDRMVPLYPFAFLFPVWCYLGLTCTLQLRQQWRGKSKQYILRQIVQLEELITMVGDDRLASVTVQWTASTRAAQEVTAPCGSLNCSAMATLYQDFESNPSTVKMIDSGVTVIGYRQDGFDVHVMSHISLDSEPLKNMEARGKFHVPAWNINGDSTSWYWYWYRYQFIPRTTGYWCTSTPQRFRIMFHVCHCWDYFLTSLFRHSAAG